MTIRLLGTAVAILAFVSRRGPDQESPGADVSIAAGRQDPRRRQGHCRAIGGETVQQEFEKSIKDKLGAEGFLGVDLKRPVVGYSDLSESADSTGAVIVVPITKEEEFVAFLKRAKIDAEAVKDDKGFYKLTSKEDQKNAPTAMRVVGNVAYLG